MAVFIGTNGSDLITRFAVTAGVTVSPPGSRPSNEDDQILGREGDDILDGGGGDDYMSGGAGTDWAQYFDAPGATLVDMRIAGAQNTVSSGVDTLIGIENISGSNFNDELNGNDASNTIYGKDGVDLAYGHAGNDYLAGGNGRDFLYGEAGDDTLDGGAGLDWATYVTASAGVIVSLAAVGGQDTVGAGIDTLWDIENVGGTSFNDILTGGGNANILYGFGGADVLFGGAGDDELQGFDGEDTLHGEAGNDKLDGGTGTDWASYYRASAGVLVSLLATGAQDTQGAGVDTLSRIESLIGSNFSDTLSGDAAANIIYGYDGLDYIFGQGGNDYI